MKGRDFYNRAIEKAIKWNHGHIPGARIQLTFVFNELEGKVVLDEAELRRRFSLCNGCAWKEKCLEVRLKEEGICPDLLAPHEVLKEILGEVSDGSATGESHKTKARRGRGGHLLEAGQ